MSVEVTQADRKAGQAIVQRMMQPGITEMHQYADYAAEMIASVRHQAKEAMRERVATKVEQRLALIPTLTDRAGSAVLACLPDAIRSIDTRGE